MTTEADRIVALAKHTGCGVKTGRNYFGYVPTYESDGGEYLVVDDAEADEMARDYVLDSLWAFDAGFLADQLDLPYEAREMISCFQERMSEGANATLQAMVKDEDSLVAAAISADGRGHFLAGYDGEEAEVEIDGRTLYVYRVG